MDTDTNGNLLRFVLGDLSQPYPVPDQLLKAPFSSRTIRRLCIYGGSFVKRNLGIYKAPDRDAALTKGCESLIHVVTLRY